MNKLEIKKEHYIAEGLARTCYNHPDHDDLCVKIGHPNIEFYRLYKEIKYFNKIKNRDTSKFDYLFYSDFHEEVDTNLGKGFVFDLIRDEESREISLTLEHYLEMQSMPFSKSVLIEALKKLKQQMIKHKVFAKDLRTRNLCCKILKDNSIELIIIDGIGHRDFFPFVDWFEFFAKKKVEKNFEKDKINKLLLTH